MLVLIVALVAPIYLVLVVAYGASPWATDAGYAPFQPIAYSHRLHAGELGIDCRYCHTTVNQAACAAVPPTQTCINCHSREYGIRKVSEKLLPLRAAFYGTDAAGSAGRPIPWVRVHDLPDYAYFDHSAHVNRGVGCVECHGRVDRMDVVYQAKPLGMGWCLECHRNPGARLRPLDQVTNMTWEGQAGPGFDPLKEFNIRSADYLQNCSTCHR